MTKPDRRTRIALIVTVTLVVFAYVLRALGMCDFYSHEVGVARSFIYIGIFTAWGLSLRNRIIQASSLLEILLSGLVLIGLLLSAVPLIKWMPGLLFDGNEVEIRIFLERSLDIVIGIEFIKMLAKHSPGSSLEVLLYAIARHLVVGHDSAVENLLSVGAIALIFIVRKFFFVPAFGAHLTDGHPAPDLSPKQSGVPAEEFISRLKDRAKAEAAEAIPSEEETFDEYDFEQAAPEPK